MRNVVASAPLSDVTGIPFGSYRLIRRIAIGGMAEVFLARQTGLEGFDRLCALKRILPHLVASREFVDMFLDEARLASQLRHPNVVHIYDLGKVDDAYFIAMEYVDGVAAGRLIQHAGREPIPFELIARIGASACAGLDHAHNLRDVEGNPLALVHRDVSPPNLLVSYEGAIKLVDFGIAKAESSIEQTRPGVVKGKYAYMSPEQTTGNLLDGRSDVFSLGIVLWEMLSGKPAVRRDDPIEGMKAIRDGKVPPIESVRKDTPAELARALGAALAVNPDNRVSALELGLALERFIKRSTGMSSNLELAQWVRERFPRQEQDASIGPGPTRQATAATGHLARSLTEIELSIAQRGTASGDANNNDDSNSDVMRTEISAPLFPDGSPLAGPTAIAIGLEIPSIKPKSSRPLLIGALLALVAAAVVTVVALRGPSEGRASSQPAPAVDAAQTLALLEVLALPEGARVTVDGELVEGPMSLPPGRHKVAVSLEGATTKEREVDLAAGERHTLELTLERTKVTRKKNKNHKSAKNERDHKTADKTEKKAPGNLRARSIPYAEVYLGSRKLGVTPLSVPLPPGKHRLRFVNPPTQKTRTKLVTIKAGETTPVSVKL